MSRIQSLPRRDWRALAEQVRGPLTAQLRTPTGTQNLFPIQAAALHEIGQCQGAVVFARVGAGKTHVSGLAPTVLAPLGYTRPLIVVPANLRAKTEKEFTALRQDWRITTQYWLKSYTFLSQMKNADWLLENQPDTLVFDEPDALRRIGKNACVKRVMRYVALRREQKLPLAIVFLAGTPHRDACTDYLHWLVMALQEGAPAPLEIAHHGEVSAYLDSKEAGCKSAFETHYGRVASHEQAVETFRSRLTETPGVIVSDDSYEGATLSCHVHYVDPGLNDEFKLLRDLCQRPDGWELLDEADAEADEVNTWSIWGVARQLALGFYYQPDPPPPVEWAKARSAWCKYVRDVLEAEGSELDTEKQVRTACEKAQRPPDEWIAWRDIKDTFVPNRTPVWLSSHAIEHAKQWGRMGPGIIWVDHVAFGERLAAETGWTYYGQNGLSAGGMSIEDAPGNAPVIASRRANQRGRNLQRQFHRNFITALPPCARDIEQLFGRTHRHGQTQENVHVDVYVTCKEFETALDKIGSGADAATGQLGMSMKWNGLALQTFGSRPSGRAFG